MIDLSHRSACPIFVGVATRSVALIAFSLLTLALRAQTPAPAPGLEKWRKSRIGIYMNDFGELDRYRAANAALGAPKAGEDPVVFFGDSINELWVLAAP